MSATKRATYAAIIGNLAIAATKLVAAAVTASSSMLTEGIHSVVDAGNDSLMLVGLRAIRKPPDEMHPFGHGRALYFYTLMAAVLIFGIGGGLSIYEGVRHMLEPARMENVAISYVLAVAAAFEGTTWYFGLKAFWQEKGPRTIWRAIRTTKDPTTFAVLLEDSAALIGIGLAAGAIALAGALRWPALDGLGSILIGLLLCAAGAIMLRESKDLLVGESASRDAIGELQRVIARDPDVSRLVRLLTMQLGPHSILLAVDLEFRPGLSAADAARAIVRIERNVMDANRDVRHVFVEAQAVKGAGHAAADHTGSALR
jgi:cation diffusion facilitator family transporter